jgi:hypothetical protein
MSSAQNRVESHTLSVAFTPSDVVDYSSGSATVSLTVNEATPTVVLTSFSLLQAASSSNLLNANIWVVGEMVISSQLTPPEEWVRAVRMQHQWFRSNLR